MAGCWIYKLTSIFRIIISDPEGKGRPLRGGQEVEDTSLIMANNMDLNQSMTCSSSDEDFEQRPLKRSLQVNIFVLKMT